MFAGAVSIGAHLIGNTDILLVRDFDTVAHNVPFDRLALGLALLGLAWD